jgi:hypothetical protein
MLKYIVSIFVAGVIFSDSTNTFGVEPLKAGYSPRENLQSYGSSIQYDSNNYLLVNSIVKHSNIRTFYMWRDSNLFLESVGCSSRVYSEYHPAYISPSNPNGIISGVAPYTSPLHLAMEYSCEQRIMN